MHRFAVILLTISLLLCACAQSAPPAVTDPNTPTAQAPTAAATVPAAVPTFPPGIQPEYFPAPSEARFEPAAPSSVESLLQAMTLEEKVGQLFLARCPDIRAVEDIQAYHLGGYILFGRDFQGQTPQTVAKTISQYQAASAIPMLIAVDEEGGTVTRVSSYKAFRSSRFPSPRNLYRQGGLSLLLSTEAEKCQLLRSLGIQVNMAPVCDITTDSRAFMYSRSLGLSAQDTATAIAEIVQTMNTHQVGSVLKHFPGYGNNTDTHVGIAVDNRSLKELENRDLLPFAAGIQSGCGAILMSHTIVTALDSDFPVSLSLPAHRYIRQTMGFDGVIVTDDLVMGAITKQYGAEEAAVLAVLAGNDLLCSSEYAIQYRAVLEAFQSGRIPSVILDSAVRRVLQWKHTLGFL